MSDLVASTAVCYIEMCLDCLFVFHSCLPAEKRCVLFLFTDMFYIHDMAVCVANSPKGRNQAGTVQLCLILKVIMIVMHNIPPPHFTQISGFYIYIFTWHLLSDCIKVCTYGSSASIPNIYRRRYTNAS